MRLRPGIGLAVFSLLAGSRWLADAVWPSTLPPLLGQSLQCTVTGTLALIFMTLRKSEARRGGLRFLPVAAAGVLLFGVPLALQQIASSVRPETSVAFYAMVPLCVVLGMAMLNDGDRASLVPALVGLAGALLLLPWQLLFTRAGAAAFVPVLAGVLATAIGSVWLHQRIRGASFPRSVAIVALSSAPVLGLTSVAHGERLLGLSRGDVVSTFAGISLCLLLIWLIGELTPERLASRFFLVPLVTIVEGAGILRAPLDARMGIGVLLLMYGAGSLAFGGEESGVSLSIAEPDM